MLDSHGGLSIAILIYYSPGILLALYVCKRQGLAQAASWLYLITLPLVRLIGAACEIAAEQNPSIGLYTAAAICNSIGLVPLLLTLAAFVGRINDGTPHKIPSGAFLLHHLATLTGLALAIAGGIKAIPTNTRDEISLGTNLREAGSLILLLVFLVTIAFTVLLFTRKPSIRPGDRKILYAAVASLPFISIRAIYLVLVAWDSKSKTFNAQEPNVFAQAFMQVVMEFIAFAIFVAAGLVSPAIRDGGEGEEREGDELKGGDSEGVAIVSSRQGEA